MLTLWTVRLGLIFYFSAVMLWTVSRARPRLVPPTRLLWSIACALNIAHVLAAFHVHHGWSHAAAYEHTAQRTEALLGLDWGGGVYFNYLFVFVWTADVTWWWLSPGSYRSRARWIRFAHLATHSYLFFIVLNATVIFETGRVRTFGALGCLALLTTLVMTRRRN